MLHGFSDEFHQSFVEGRSSAWGDLIADIVGGFMGAIVFSISRLLPHGAGIIINNKLSEEVSIK